MIKTKMYQVINKYGFACDVSDYGDYGFFTRRDYASEYAKHLSEECGEPFRVKEYTVYSDEPLLNPLGNGTIDFSE